MTGHAEKWNQKMESSTLSPDLKLLSYNTELLPKLMYPLPVISISGEEASKIIKPALPAIKNAMGLPQTAQGDDLMIPKTYGGFGVVDLEAQETAVQAKYMVQHLRNNDSLGRRLRILVEDYQLEAGTSQSILERATLKKLNYLTPSLLLDQLRRLSKLGLTLRFKHWVPRSRSKTIMDLILAGNCGEERLRRVNTCRTSL